MQALDRLLALVCRELGATRAWIEYASAPATDVVSAPVRDGWMICADVDDATDDTQALLEGLAASFDRVLLEAAGDAPTPAQPSESGERLREALDVLVSKVGAHAAWVFDERSPVLWGASSDGNWLTDLGRARVIGQTLGDHPPQLIMGWAGGQQLPAAPAELAPHLPTIAAAAESIPAERLITTWAAVGEASTQAGAWAWDRGSLHVRVRPLAGIYRLLVLFEGEFSPLHAETTINRALPVIERLVTDHPPVDPTPKGARIHAFVRPE
ncbi:MAG: hypothetical protein ACE37F_34380 [Nannocystaceae bacterium]|nr:hypothetical protein [bacterium]